ncbi:MAG: hypothetical protein H6707_09390 [Deltaproteobacteria bacterium]|nr:hypothetical protein [Deltaproteobacteria bacterium]
MRSTPTTMLTILTMLHFGVGCGVVSEQQLDRGTGKAEGQLEDQLVRQSCLAAKRSLHDKLSSEILSQIDALCDALRCDQGIAEAVSGCNHFAASFDANGQVSELHREISSTVCSALRCSKTCIEALNCMAACKLEPACLAACAEGATLVGLEHLATCVDDAVIGACAAECAAANSESCPVCVQQQCQAPLHACQ